MKSLKTLMINIIFLIVCIPLFSQTKRLKPPKKSSKITSVDAFVDNTFLLYHKVFVYDSLTNANVEVPSDLEDELLDSMKKDLDSMWQVFPVILDEMDSGASVLKKAKAVANLNKAKKALKFCIKASKNYLVGTKDEEEN